MSSPRFKVTRELTFQLATGNVSGHVGYLLAASKSQPHIAAFAGSAVEAAFAATILLRVRRVAAV